MAVLIVLQLHSCSHLLGRTVRKMRNKTESAENTCFFPLYDIKQIEADDGAGGMPQHLTNKNVFRRLFAGNVPCFCVWTFGNMCAGSLLSDVVFGLCPCNPDCCAGTVGMFSNMFFGGNPYCSMHTRQFRILMNKHVDSFQNNTHRNAGRNYPKKTQTISHKIS